MQPLHHLSKYPNLLKTLSIDCASCSGLCCIALCFSKMDGFPLDKADGVPCPHMMDRYTCDIHQELNKKKLTGCMAYECFGAGPWATSLFSMTWKNSHKKDEIFKVYQILYRLQEMLGYLLEASTIREEERISSLLQEYQKIMKFQPAEFLIMDIENYQKRVNQVLKIVCQEVGCYDFHQNTLYNMGKNFYAKDLSYVDFSMCILIGSDLRKSMLYGTNFLGADIRDVNLCDSDLRNCLFLTQRQINSAKGNHQTRLPSHLKIPSTW